MTAPTFRTTRQMPAQMLGTDISGADNLSQALEIAGLDWTLLDEPADNLSVVTADGITNTSFPGHRLLMRSDDTTTLGVVGGRYEAVDNATAFGVADAAKSLGATFAHAGEIDGGRKTFLTMEVPEATCNVGGYDLVKFGVTLRTSHDGSGAITGSADGTRLVCTNGMRTSLEAGRSWTIRHTRSADTRMEEAHELIQNAMIFAKEFTAHASALIEQKMTTNDFDQLLDVLLPAPGEDATARVINGHQRRRDQLMDLWASADTQEEGRNTAWAAYNAVVEWDQWIRPANNGDEGRALRNFNTNAAGLPERTFALLTA